MESCLDESCIWPVVYPGGCAALDGLPPEQKALIEQAAIDYLWNWTNKVFGVCNDTVRPCREECEGSKAWYSTFWGKSPGYDPGFPANGMRTGWTPVLIAGQWYNIGCGYCGEARCNCGLGGPETIRLPGPIQSVQWVKVDGRVLPPTAYGVMYGRLLVRTDGETWPTCQNLMLEDDKPDTFSIAYMHGTPVPVGGQVAAGILACEMAKAMTNDGTCQLPKRLQTVTRQGITVGVFDDFQEMKQNGATGIWQIDSWLASVNQPIGYASVRSVDVKPRV